MQPWVYGYHRHPVLTNWWPYVDVDGDAQRKALGTLTVTTRHTR